MFKLSLVYLGHTGIYLVLLIVVSVLLCLSQIAFQVFLAVVGNDFIKKCEFLEILLRHVGLVRLDELDTFSIVKWLLPEVISFVGSIVIFIVLKRASTIDVEALNGDANETRGSNNQIAEDAGEISAEKWGIFVKVGKVLSLLALCATGAIQPSALSVIYYLAFLGSATWWGMNKQLERYASLRFTNPTIN